MTRYPLTRRLYGTHAEGRRPVMLFDVGCSTGVFDKCDAFGAHLHAVGFDLLEAEVERLRTTEGRPNVRYEAARVGLDGRQRAERDAYEAQLPAALARTSDVRGRSSGARARELTGFDHRRSVFNAGADLRVSSRCLSLDEYALQTGIDADVIKIDTDGDDMQVLLGAEHVLRRRTLCVFVEAMFHTPLSRYANSFANIDLYLRSLGFSLYGLSAYQYTRAALPGIFYYDMFAQTREGQVVWADCLYFRDLAAPGYPAAFSFEVGDEQVVPLACLFEQFGLDDCAAELVLRFPQAFPTPVGDLLDTIVPDCLGPGLSYDAYLRRFEQDPAQLFSSRHHRPSGKPIVTAPLEAIDLRAAQSAPDWPASLSNNADGSLRVETGGAPWAYAATLRLGPFDGSGLVAVDLSVLQGKIGLAIMGRRGLEDLSGEVWIDASSTPRHVLLPVSDLGRGASLLVRNGGPERQVSVAVVHTARVLRN